MRVVLTISDEEATRESLRQILTPGCLLFGVSSVSEARELFLAHDVDVLILDAPASYQEFLHVSGELWELDPDLPIVALSVTCQETMVEEAKSRGVFDVLPKPFSASRLQETLERAAEHGEAQRRKSRSRFPGPEAAHPPVDFPEQTSTGRLVGAGVPNRFASLLRGLTRARNLEELAEGAIQGVVEYFSASSAALFVDPDSSGRWQLLAQYGLDPSLVPDLALGLESGLVRGLVRSRRILRTEAFREAAAPPETYRELKAFRAELVVPLWREGRLLGWLCVGPRMTGRVYAENDLELLATLSPVLSDTVLSALAYQQAKVQRQEYENILRSIGEGVVAVDREGRITVLNSRAETLLKVSAQDYLGRKIQKLSSSLADLLLRTLERRESEERVSFTQAGLKASFIGSSSFFTDTAGEVSGAAVNFVPQGEEVVRADTGLTGFLTEDISEASAWVAHLVRNRLVPIKTYCELLPTKYENKDFRESFSEIVGEEVERLDEVIARLNEFAKPVALKTRQTDLFELAQDALARMEKGLDELGLKAETAKPEPLPIRGDPSQLRESLIRFFADVAEAAGTDKTMKLEVSPYKVGDSGAKEEATLVCGIRLFVEGAEAKQVKRVEKLFRPYGEETPDYDVFGEARAHKVILAHEGWVEEGRARGGELEVRVFLPREEAPREKKPSRRRSK